MEAAANGYIAAMDTLLAAGADVPRVNDGGNTALHLASLHGRLDVARVLLDAGARTDVYTRSGKRPIDVVRVHARSCVSPQCKTPSMCAGLGKG
jgi:uncharacterized protein